MFGILVTIELIISVILIVVVLMQASKGGGLAGSFGGGQMGTVFGVRRTADFLSRATTILATVFIGLSIIINLFFLPGKTTSTESIIQRGGAPTAVPQPVPPQTSQPAATQHEQGKK